MAENTAKETTLTPAAEQQETALSPAAMDNSTPTMWNNTALMRNAWKTADMISRSALVPDTYRGRPENCLIAIDASNRLGISPLMVMQNLYVVKGKPSWSGQFCAAAINGCGKFTPLEYVFVDEGGGGCYAIATRIRTGAECRSDTVTMQMAKDEGWLQKSGSKWQTMPRQMMMYRAAAFFARAHCPEVLLGLQTIEEVQDVNGYAEPEKATVVINLEGSGNG